MGKIEIPVAVKKLSRFTLQRSPLQSFFDFYLEKSADNGAIIAWNIVIKSSI